MKFVFWVSVTNADIAAVEGCSRGIAELVDTQSTVVRRWRGIVLWCAGGEVQALTTGDAIEKRALLEFGGQDARSKRSQVLKLEIHPCESRIEIAYDSGEGE